MQLNGNFLIEDEATLRAAFAPTHQGAIDKCQTQLDIHSKAFIARSPFVVIGTQKSDGAADVSPRGDPCGFVQAPDNKTLLIPDRPGNNRLDTLSNIVANPFVGLLFMVPGFDDTMRVNGRAQISRDPDLCGRMAVNGRMPGVVIVVTVEEVFIHCSKAFRRSKLWDPAAVQARRDMPSLRQIVHDQNNTEPLDPDRLAQLDAALEQAYKDTMY